MLATDQWANRHEVSVPSVQKITFKVRRHAGADTFIDPKFPQLALFVIATCGFGISFDWEEPLRSENRAMPIQQAFRIISDTGIFAVFAPKWVKRLPFK